MGGGVVSASRFCGERVRNRQTWIIDEVAADGSITAHHDQLGHVNLPADYVAEHVELGWAVTGYGNQGDTVDIGIAVLEPTSSRNHAYVAMTRGRDANHALMIDATGTADSAEQLAEVIARPASAESALAVQQRLHRAADLEPPDHHDRSAARPTDEEPPTPPGEPDPSSTTLEAARLKMQRRLHQLENRPARQDQGPSLGL